METEKLLFQIDGTLLTYTATDITEKDGFILFVDRFGQRFEYRKDLLLSRRPVGGGRP